MESIMHLSARLVNIFQMVWSWAASSTDHPESRRVRSLWITSLHVVIGQPRLRFPWVGFHSSLLSCHCPCVTHVQTISACASVGCLWVAAAWSLILCVYLECAGTRQFAESSSGIACQKHLVGLLVSRWDSNSQQHTVEWTGHMHYRASSLCRGWCSGLSILHVVL